MKTILIIAFVILISSADVFSKNTDYSVDTILIQSEILNEQRKVIIYKPADVSYSDSVKFIYLIDGEYSNYRYNLMKERYGDSLSNMIAVGIINTERIRDLLYARSADKFLEFITSELIPSIEKDYITKTRIYMAIHLEEVLQFIQ
jgi:enterochelin esterase-like enzyme